jgi:hypothetical protein
MSSTLSSLLHAPAAKESLKRWRRRQLTSLISRVDEVVFTHRDDAYADDEHGVHANPCAPLWLLATISLLALLMRLRDGQPPRWWRKPGQPPRPY